ncbi:aminotransferase class I and II [Saitoella complicata NRRL Y-17804]|nr:aminotransferase class I and II [Saitoella complicata NRRL Y-17804]ODQ51961.1 aminotransferase class I and II [Saitoella complicata NRRL Y-17804]
MTEHHSSAHQNLRKARGNEHVKHREHLPGISHPGSTGVIYCTERATALGYSDKDSEWANFGQGAPETPTLPGGFEKPTTITVSNSSREYGPTAGIKELREAVANLYNEQYRQGKESKYNWENVCIVPGGRAGLIRIAAMLGETLVSYFIPDYTAYSDMLSQFKSFSPFPIPLSEEDKYHVNEDLIRDELKRGVSVILTSNPRNPTGQVLRGEELKRVQEMCRGKCTLLFDEFYSGYNYTSDADGKTISSAEYVEDVDEDSVVIIDGLTKSFRLPGWRICWVIGPKEFIKGMGSTGSFLDGGASHPLQEAAIPLLKVESVRKEMKVLQEHFIKKRDYVLDRLSKMNLSVAYPPEATFYIWLDLSHLTSPELSNGLSFFEECLKEKVIVVPGIFFDLNPSKRRELFDSPCHHFVRLSFGPGMEVLRKGLDGIERVLRKFGEI